MTTISWTTAATGDWSSAALWSPATVPNGAGIDALIGVAGAYTVTLDATAVATLDGLTLASAGAALLEIGTLVFTGSRALRVAAGTLELAGTITGAVLTDAGGSVQYDDGTLVGATFLGTMDLTAPGAALTLNGGITLGGAAGGGPGTVLIGESSLLFVEGTTTLDNATVTLVSSGYTAYGLASFDANATGVVLTLGAHLLVRDSAAADGVAGGYVAAGVYAGDRLINQGTILADTAGGLFRIGGNSFTNLGTMSVGNGDLLSIGSTAFTNLAASTLQLNNNVAIVTLAADLTLNGAGAAVLSFQTGTMTMLGLEATLATIGPAGALRLLGGRGFTAAKAIVDNGLLALAGGTLGAPGLTLGASGTLFGNGVVTPAVALAGVLQADGGTLLLAAGATGAGLLRVDAASTLELAAATTAGTVSDAGVLWLDGASLAGASLTVASGGTLLGFGTVTGSVTSSGLLDASGGTLALTGALGGTGALRAEAGAVLILNQAAPATITGSVTLNGPGSAIRFGVGGAAVALETGVTAIAATGALAVLGGRSYTATHTLSDAGLLTLAGGTLAVPGLGVLAGGRLTGYGTVAGAVVNAGTIESTGPVLEFTGAISGAGTLLVDGHTSLELLGGVGAAAVIVNGILRLQNDALTAGTVTVTAVGRLQGEGTILGPVADSGTIEVYLGQLTLTQGATGTGTVQIDATGTVTLAAASSLGVILDSGLLLLDGVSVAAGGATVAATGILQGPGTLSGPIADAGTVDAAGGRLTLAGAVTGAGSLRIEAGATLELAAAAAPAVTFAPGGTGLLVLDAPGAFRGAIAGLAVGDAIRFATETVTSAALNGATLTVVGSAGTFTDTVAGALAGNHVVVGTDQHTVTLTSGALALSAPAFQAAAAPVAAASVAATEVPDAAPPPVVAATLPPEPSGGPLGAWLDQPRTDPLAWLAPSLAGPH
jgi:hypothetical protein